VAGACGARGAGPGAGPGRGWGRARLLALMGHGGAFYLEVRELEEKCFIQEIPDGTVVIGARPHLPSPAGGGLGRKGGQQNLLARQYGPQGSFTFTSQSPGEHQICLHLESIRFALFYDGKLAIHLDMQLGEHTNDYAEFAAKDKLTQLHLRLQQLVEQVELIQKEQEYQRVRGWVARAPTSGCCGGPFCRPSSWWPQVSGRCSTSRVSLKPRSWLAWPGLSPGSQSPNPGRRGGWRTEGLFELASQPALGRGWVSH
uniref:Transmembrane emp24 domain-containing protein 9-like n=1 Tax=Ursus maritimus TaxID=29073 RepID=A0A452VHI9_URSMA